MDLKQLLGYGAQPLPKVAYHIQTIEEAQHALRSEDRLVFPARCEYERPVVTVDDDGEKEVKLRQCLVCRSERGSAASPSAAPPPSSTIFLSSSSSLLLSVWEIERAHLQ